MNYFKSLSLFFLLTSFLVLDAAYAQGFEGYYRYPDIHGEQLVFTAEGDLWTVSLAGGLAQRLTSHAEEERWPRISPDGRTVAFTASYEGPGEVYSMPITGGLPTRWTYESDFSLVNCWTPDGKIVYDTRAFATLPDRQLVMIDTRTKEKTRIPLSQASEASFSEDGKTVYFVRPSFHGNVTKRYKGGTARQIWKFTEGTAEAIKLTKDYPGESLILEKLLRQAWMYWKSRSGKPYWNMQYAFRGHIVILVDENTASDGEAFADGFKKLNLGTAIGMRTWGGEIWLSGANRLSDGGIARAPMMGVYGADGTWLIEGHGFEPDIEVDNPPHATFKGEDAQLQAAIDLLKKMIEEDPREVPPVPAYPDKSFQNKE